MDVRWKHPWAALVAGPSSSGKTTFVKKFLRYLHLLSDMEFSEIIFYFSEWQPTYKELAETKKIDFREGVPRGSDFENSDQPRLVIIDDLMTEIDKNVVNVFTRASHHRNLSVFFLTQNLFHKGQRDISLNSNYIVIFKNPRDNAQILHFARQIYPENPLFVREAFHDATEKPHGYLLIDLKQNTPENYRLRTNIFPDDGHPMVYLPRKSIKSRSRTGAPPV